MKQLELFIEEYGTVDSTDKQTTPTYLPTYLPNYPTGTYGTCQRSRHRIPVHIPVLHLYVRYRY